MRRVYIPVCCCIVECRSNAGRWAERSVPKLIMHILIISMANTRWIIVYPIVSTTKRAPMFVRIYNYDKKC